MYENLFLPQETSLVTLRGIKRISEMNSKDIIIAIDRFGLISFVNPIIEKPESFGILCNFKTSYFDFSVGLDKKIFVNNDFDMTLSTGDICDTLTGYNISMTSGCCYSDSNNLRYADWAIVLYALAMLKRTKYVDDDIRIISRGGSKSSFIESYLSRSGVKFRKEPFGKRNRVAFYIGYKGKIKRRISKDFVMMCNSRQAKLFVETCMLFDSVPNRDRCERGHIFLCQPQNISLMIALCMKAGYRVHAGNVYGISQYKYDSIIVSNHSGWDTNIISHTISQNTSNDVHVIISDEYVGFLAVYDSCIVVLPNDMYLNKFKAV